MLAQPSVGLITGTAYYVDCSRGDDSAAGTSAAAPWLTMGRANAVTLGPGDAILFNRGTTCTGVLAPNGSGSAAQPIRISAYGAGPAPELAGNGARQTVLLHNVDGYELSDLSISDYSLFTKLGELRAGIYVLRDGTPAVGHHYAINNVRVHDVISNTVTFSGGPENIFDNYGKTSGGIVFVGGTGFDDITITNNGLARVHRTGILIRSGTSPRTTGVTISGNQLEHVGGDGLIIEATDGATVDHNTLDRWNESFLHFSAGLWSYNSNNMTFEYNTVTRGAHAPFDSYAYDFDGGNSNVTYQYNFSADNSGGALLVCAGQQAVFAPQNLVYRYNISQNDGVFYRGDQLIRAVIDVPSLCGAATDVVHIYNNTFYSKAFGVIGMLENSSKSTLFFENNIFAGPGPLVTLRDLSKLSQWQSNLYAGLTCLRGTDASAVVANPQFVAPGTARSQADADGYRLRQGSAALGKGTPIADDGGRDYYGNPISNPPNIGAYQGPGLGSAAPVLPALALGCGP